LKSPAADIDKEPIRWSLSWKPDGRSESFTREAILAAAPSTSGVYGLFNFDCQLFIGESASIQKALLRHESETDFQSGHLRPTGFTFEPCATELRAVKAAELIARFRPVLQTEAALTEASSPSNGSIASEPRLDGRVLETYSDHRELPGGERAKHPKIHRRFYFDRTRGIVSAALFAAAAVVIFYLGLFTNKNIQERANGASEKSPPRVPIAQSTASGQVGIDSRPQNVSSIETAGVRANRSAAPIPAKPGVHTSQSTDDVSKKWSVQISAVPGKAVADTLIERLKASGYDTYVVKAEVKGQTYYRVRVGHFDAREEAESVRQSLASQEGYRDAYLTSD
jgi:cell division septation protein DedD